MAISTYTPTGIIHNTSVDFTSRPVSQPIHIVQYDDTLPTLAVEMYQDGQSYALSADATAVLRFGKKDSTFVIVNPLGCSEDRTILYFAIDVQMTIIEGEYRPVIEVTDNSHVASSSPVYMVIDRNPVQRSDIESKVEFKQLVEYRDEAQTAAGEAKESETIVKTSETNAKASETAAKTSETNAAASESNAKASETAAKTSETNAGNSATEAESYAKGGTGTRTGEDTDNSKWYSEQAAKSLGSIDTAKDEAVQAASAAKTSETNAKASETAAKTSETNAKTSETNAKASEAAAKTSETNAKTSESNANSSETASGLNATSAANSASAAKTSETNAKTSEVNADASAKAAAQAASSVQGVKYSKSQWYLSTSATEETGGKWVDTMPELTAGKYLWNRTFTDYSDGSSTTSVAVVVTGIDALRDAIADEVTRAQTAEKDNATAITTEENRAKAAEGIKANKPSYVDKILASSGWSDGIFSFDTDYPFASYDLKVFLSPNATDEQYKAWSKAGVNTGSETANSIKAFGTIPTVDIPILLKVVEK